MPRQTMPRHVRPELETRMRRAVFCGGALILACAVTGGYLAFEVVQHYTAPSAPKGAPPA